MTPRKGAWVPLSPGRRIIVELMHHARKVPTLPTFRRMDLAALVRARGQACPAPSWTAIFMRAYGLVGRDQPCLRRAYLPYPWPHLYEHPETECGFLVEKDLDGELVVLGAKLRGPENRSLTEIDIEIRRFREAPVLEVRYFRQLLRLGRMPGFVRRFVFWHTLYLSGYKRAKHFGTCGLSTIGDLGANHHPLTPLTTYLTFGPIGTDGAVDVTIVYDHRVMDGRTVARCLGDLERVLNGVILAELHSLRGAACA